MGSIIENLAEKTFDNFKKITPALTAVSILSGLILFLPDNILEKMSLNELPVIWRRIVGIAFLLSIALIVTIVCFSVRSRIMETVQKHTIQKKLRRKIDLLSPQQREIIISLLKSSDKTISLDKNAGDTVYLEANGFLHMPQQVISLGFDNGMIVTYVPQPWLMELYNDDPELFN